MTTSVRSAGCSVLDADWPTGEGTLEKALARQWIQFQASLDLGERKEAELRKINDSLAGRPFLAGLRLTAADVLLYHG